MECKFCGAKIDDKDVFELSMDDVILIDTVSNIE